MIKRPAIIAIEMNGIYVKNESMSFSYCMEGDISFFYIVTKAEAVARLQGNYAADIEGFNAVHAQAMHMAEALSDGIRTQFPEIRGLAISSW
jgi:hypothetical protein